ncbi:hypothetical protein BGX29_005055 [Mortierella sp. GBA35]|nr:hypothetical protein BGX29_005055 [Mortierella sp. GBA35]
MKVLSTSLCLAAAVCIAAQAAPEQAVQQSYFAMAMQRDEPQDIVSEIEQGAAILALFDIPKIPGIPEFPTIPIPEIPTPTCDNLPSLIGGLIPVLDQGSANLGLFAPLPTVIQTIIGVIKTALSTIELGAVTDTVLHTINTVLTTIITPLKLLQFLQIPGIDFVVSQVLNILDFVSKAIGVNGCGTPSKIEIKPTTCSVLADVYRASVKTAAEKFTGANDVNKEELKKLIEGSLAVLSLMDQSSIANSNDALLSTHPIFSGSLLDQYRRELIQKADSETLKNLAQIDLAMMVSVSSGLETCLRVAANPKAAAEELVEEYEAMADDEEYDDEE